MLKGGRGSTRQSEGLEVRTRGMRAALASSFAGYRRRRRLPDEHQPNCSKRPCAQQCKGARDEWSRFAARKHPSAQGRHGRGSAGFLARARGPDHLLGLSGLGRPPRWLRALRPG